MEYQVYLDSVLVTEPIGLDELEITIERDNEIRGLLVKFTSDLRFIGDGYDALLAKKDDEGITATVDCLIQYRESDLNAWATLFEGLIFISDVTFSLIKREAITSVEDNSFTARISNNKNIEANFDVNRSKNDETITAVTTIDIDFYDPVDVLATYKYPNLKCYRVYDCFRFIIDFMSDGLLNFDSNFFDTGDGEGIFITTGKILSGTNDDDPLITTFFDLYTEMDKRFNLSFRVDTSTTPPTVVIEPLNDFYVDTTAVTLDDPEEVNMKFDRGRLYSTIDFGNNVYTDFNTLDHANYPSIPMFGHQSESFHVLGEANLDNNLELTGQWSTDSNSIEQAVIGTTGVTTGTTGFKLIDSGANFNSGVEVGMRVYNLTDGTSTTIDAIDSATQLDLASDIFTSGETYKIATRTAFDDNIFIIQTDYPANDRATKNDDFYSTLTVYLYNVLLNNYNVSLNYFAGIHNSIASFLSDNTEGAIVKISFPGLSYSSMATDVVLWNSVTEDPGGNYNVLNGRFTVPVNGAGAYVVGATFKYNCTALDTDSPVATMNLKQYDSGGTLIRSEPIYTFTYGDGGEFSDLILGWGGSRTFYAADGDYFTAEIEWLLTGTIDITAGAVNGFTASPVASSPVAQIYDPRDFRGVMYDMDYPITQTEWETINNDLTYKINFTARNVTYGGWIEKLIYQHKRKMATITLVSTN